MRPWCESRRNARVLRTKFAAASRTHIGALSFRLAHRLVLASVAKGLPQPVLLDKTRPQLVGACGVEDQLKQRKRIKQRTLLVPVTTVAQLAPIKWRRTKSVRSLLDKQR